MYVAFGEHFVESGECLGCSCEDDESGDWSVEPVADAEEDLSRFLVFLLDILLDQVGQRRVACLIALHNLAALLCDDDDVVVLVDYFHRVSFSFRCKVTIFF